MKIRGMSRASKNIILFVGNVPDRYIEAIESLREKLKKDFKVAVIAYWGERLKLSGKNRKKIHYLIRCNSRSEKEIRKKLGEIKKELLVIFLVFENFANFYCKVLRAARISTNPPIASVKKA